MEEIGAMMSTNYHLNRLKVDQSYWWVKYLINPLSLWTLVIINTAGSVYGYFWYHRQLAESPWYWWPLIPDSPFSSTLITILLIALLRNKYPPTLALWANLSAIKYGLWAALININYWQISGNFGIENWMLTLSHLGMAAEGLLLLLILPFSLTSVFWVGIWFGLNDSLDYLFNLHPYLFDQAQYQLAWISVITLSIILLCCSWVKLKYTTGLKAIFER
ncbi:MAG: DUF1405 domain-containing protein [Carboxydocellales bacterium]